MASPQDEPSIEPTGGLDQRVLSTLQGLQGRIAFSGLRRVLHAHPESLSRSLRRLEREGLVERADGGYRALGGLPKGESRPSTDLRAIAHVDLPPGAPADSVLGRLSGRWFGSLRWVGVVDGPSGRLLAWARRDGVGYVLLGIDRGVLRVYVRQEGSGDDLTEAEDSAYELLVHAVDAMRPSGQDSFGSVSFFTTEDPSTGLSFEN
jgi:DNA-binding Lrp family transcriptional regulator